MYVSLTGPVVPWELELEIKLGGGLSWTQVWDGIEIREDVGEA